MTCKEWESYNQSTSRLSRLCRDVLSTSSKMTASITFLNKTILPYLKLKMNPRLFKRRRKLISNPSLKLQRSLLLKNKSLPRNQWLKLKIPLTNRRCLKLQKLRLNFQTRLVWLRSVAIFNLRKKLTKKQSNNSLKASHFSKVLANLWTMRKSKQKLLNFTPIVVSPSTN